MNIINLPIKEIIPYERNPRINDPAVDSVAASLEEFGWQQPIVIDENNVVIAGHTRLKAAKKLGMKKVPCVKAEGLSKEQVAAYRLADNKTSETSDWDYSLLDIELQELDDLGFDMEPFGFYNIEYDAIIDSIAGDSVGYGPETFDVTFTFPLVHEDKMNKYIKKYTKEPLTELLLAEIAKESQ